MRQANRDQIIPGWIRRINRETLRADAVAGLLGAVLVLPQGVAFGSLAGLPPEYGIYTAVVPCIVAALFGSSWHVMSGPTNANSLALFAMLSPLAAPASPTYVALALAVTVIVGLMQLSIGMLRLGSLANFISPSVLLGFTCGAASLIALFALKDFLGVAVPTGTSAGGLLIFLLHNFSAINYAAVAVALATLIVTLVARRISRKLPFMLLGLLAGYATAELVRIGGWFGRQNAAVVGAIPAALPPFGMPDFSARTANDLLGISAALSIVALSQSISVAKMVASRTGQAIDTNKEFIGQGLSNIFGGFFSSYVSCGSLNRSLPNVEAGARTPLASVLSAVFLLVLVSVSAPLLSQIPLASIAAMLLLVAWSLLDCAKLQHVARISRVELLIVCVTFAATLGAGLQQAVLLGTLLSLAVYLYRTSRPPLHCVVPDAEDPARCMTPVSDLHRIQPECPQLKLVRMQGSLYFGAVQSVADQLQRQRTGNSRQRHVLILASSMNFCDIAGTQMWKEELEARRADGGDLYFHRPGPQVLQDWKKAGLLGELGQANFFKTKREALAGIIARLDPTVCHDCRVRLFEECGSDKAEHRNLPASAIRISL